MSPFERRRCPCDGIPCAGVWYVRYLLSCQDDVDLLGERGITVDFRQCLAGSEPDLVRRSGKYLRHASVDWHVLSQQMIFLSFPGRWPKPAFAAMANAALRGVPSMRMAKRWTRTSPHDAKALLDGAIERLRLHRPVPIHATKVPSCRRALHIYHRYDPQFDNTWQIDGMWRIDPDRKRSSCQETAARLPWRPSFPANRQGDLE